MNDYIEFEEYKRRNGSAPTAKNGAAKPSGVLRLARVSSVESVSISWLWRGRIAIGKVTLIAGHPGLGKSQVSVYLAAKVTTGGQWPAKEGAAPLGSVIMLSAEDDIADTIRPRLEAVGANVARVHVVKAVVEADKDRGFNLSRDLEALRADLIRIGDVKLVVIDPITAYLAGTDTHKTGDARPPR